MKRLLLALLTVIALASFWRAASADEAGRGATTADADQATREGLGACVVL
jgi:hypothetical protein